MPDFDLHRFVAAQASVIAAVRQELAAGQKRSHWMWFIFPQLRGLGRSETARHYGIVSLAEAQAFLDHPELGLRLVECTRLVNGVRGRTVHEIFGSPDDLKFHSSMTLFTRADPKEEAFRTALQTWFAGRPDPNTVALLG